MAITVLVAVAVAGCGGSGHTGGQGNASSGFLGRLPGGLIYVEWTVSGSQLSGTLYQDLVQRQRHGPETVRVDRAVLTGTLVGGRLVLSINGTANIAAAFQGTGLVLDYPDPQHSTRVGGLLVGSVLVLRMEPSTARAYHQALASLQRHAAVASATAAPNPDTRARERSPKAATTILTRDHPERPPPSMSADRVMIPTRGVFKSSS